MIAYIPAIKGKFGIHDYYLLTMKVNDVKDKVRIPKEMEEWNQLKIGEKYQREISELRIRRDIAPYFSDKNERFTSALILAVKGGKIRFHGCHELFDVKPMLKDIGLFDNDMWKSMGFVRLTAQQTLIPLDGQHRIRALQYAVSGKDEKGKDINTIDACAALGNDDVSVILVEYDAKKSRAIFSKVNRYVKPKTKTQNFITDDDDPLAVLTRELIYEFSSARIVNILKSTLSAKAAEFTTLSTLYAVNKDIISHRFPDMVYLFKQPKKITAEYKRIWKEEIRTIWTTLTKKIDVWRHATADSSPAGDDIRREIRRDELLGRTVGQRVLVRAYLNLERQGVASTDEICHRLNGVNWSIENPDFQGIIVNGDKVATGEKTITITARLIQYLCGEPLSKNEIAKLESDIKRRMPHVWQEDYTLPTRKKDG